MNENLEQLELVTNAIKNQIPLVYRLKGSFNKWEDVDENSPLDFKKYLYEEKGIQFENGRTIVTVLHGNDIFDDYLLLLIDEENIVPFDLGGKYINRFSDRSIKLDRNAWYIPLGKIQDYFGSEYKIVKVSYLNSFTYTKD